MMLKKKTRKVIEEMKDDPNSPVDVNKEFNKKFNA